MAPQRFSILNSDFEIATVDPSLAAGVLAMTATYPRTAQTPSHRFVLNRVGPLPGQEETLVLRGDGEVRYTTEHEGDLLAALELDLYNYALTESRDGVLLHAAAVARGGRALVLAGPSGAGKSTLALALTASGAGYVTDEWVQVAAGLRVRGVARPIGLEAPPAELDSRFEVFEHGARTATGATTSLRLVHPPRERLHHGAASLVALVFIEVQPGAIAELRPLPIAESLIHLGGCLVTGGAALLDTATALLGDCPTYRLVSGDIAAAAAKLESLW